MLNEEKSFYALGQFVARQAREYIKKENPAANEVIDIAVQLAPWKENAYAAGDVVCYKDYPYRCVQAHDSTGNPDWNPERAPALWANYHGTDKKHALPYVAPTGAHDAYKEGEWMIYEDSLYRCLQNAVVHAPSVLPSAWAKEES